MVIPGYDPDDLEQTLRELIDEHGADMLTDDERRRIEQGESILDVLDNEEIKRLLDEQRRRPSESSP